MESCWFNWIGKTRDELELNYSQTLLIALAIVHNDELRQLILFPEFRAGGLTSSNRVFSAFRCLLPNGSRWVFEWIINSTMPDLVGSSTRSIRRVAHESNEYLPLMTTVRIGSVWKARHSSCWYHLKH